MDGFRGRFFRRLLLLARAVRTGSRAAQVSHTGTTPASWWHPSGGDTIPRIPDVKDGRHTASLSEERNVAISPEVATLFLDEMARRNIAVTVDEKGGYVVEVGGLKSTVRLENLSRDYERDRDPDRITNFVNAITSLPELPAWDEARPRIRWQAEAADHDFGDTFHDKVSDMAALVLVYADPAEAHITWLSPAQATRWGKTRDELWAVAGANMDRMLSAATVKCESVDEHRLGMLATELTAFKAALLFCPGLKAVVEPVLGWPLYAVMPCRDFVYLLNQEDRDLLSRMGPVVVREYNQGRYPVSTEVFEITDEGVRAIGEFQKAPQTEEGEPSADADGMKTIRYRGGVVTFRIPAHWVEEYEEEGGGTFYDEDSDTGTLRLSTLLLSSNDPVTARTAWSILEGRKEPTKSDIIDLGKGNAMVRYVHEAEEDGVPLSIHYWEIANPVPPRHVRVALFSFTVDAAAAEDVVEQLALIDRELRHCEFAAEVGS